MTKITLKRSAIGIASLGALFAATVLLTSKSLTIDGNTALYKDSSVIHIPAAKYSNITIQNFNRPVTFLNTGLVEITGAMNLVNVNNITITGNGTSGITQGFYFHDNSGRALQFSRAAHNVTFQYALFKNIGDYVISTDFGNTLYKSTDSTTYCSNIHLLNLEFNNTGQINIDGDVTSVSVIGLVKNLEMAYCYLHDMSPGDLFFGGALDSYNIHHNTVNNVNTTNNNDNGIWHVQGNGTFAYNKVTNHQGHAIRAWLVSFGTTPESTSVYNNIVYNSRKYSAFEVQSFSTFLIKSKTTFGNARVFGNTCGSLNMSKDPFSAVVVDVYGLFGGSCQVFDNLGFNFPVPNPSDNIASQLYTTTPVENNNLYFTSAASAGIDTTFKPLSNSLIIGKGIVDAALTDDYYGTKRGTSPAVGAVEYTSGPITPVPPIIITYSSIASSGLFTRNNCGISSTGSQVTYSVLAGKYTSTISQADANSKAASDVTANGQAYANANGSCTAVPVSKTVIGKYVLTVYSDGTYDSQKQ